MRIICSLDPQAVAEKSSLLYLPPEALYTGGFVQQVPRGA